jgi:hypothetical protein
MSKWTGVVHFEIEDVVNCDILNVAGEDLWSSGVHVKETGWILIWGLYKQTRG